MAIGFLAYAHSMGLGASSGSYDLTASFQSAEGIKVGTDVRLAGVKVGTISKLDLNPQTFYADATLTLRETVQLPEDLAALVSSGRFAGAITSNCGPAGRPMCCKPGPRSRIPKLGQPDWPG